MKITTLHDLLAAWEAEKAADRDDTQVSPSALGNLCRRNLAYRLTLTPPSDDVDPVTVATVGSLVHLGLARLWDDDPDTLGTEVRTPGSGSTDVVQTMGAATGWRFDPDERVITAPGDGEPLLVRDTKTVSRTKFDRWERNDGPTEDVWDQVMDYGRRLGADDTWVMVVDAICRETGRCATYARPYDPAQAEQAAITLEAMQHRLGDGDPDKAPADRDGHGDWFCDSCPWLTRCMGPDGKPNVTELDPEVAAEQAAEYAHWNAIARDAEAKAKAARTALAGTSGVFDGWRVSWSVTETRTVPLEEPIYEKTILGRRTIRVERVTP